MVSSRDGWTWLPVLFKTLCNKTHTYVFVDYLNTKELLIEAEKAEYTTREYPPNFRNIQVFGDVVTLDIESEPDDAKEVFLYCHKIHTVTDSASTLNGELEDVLIIVLFACRFWAGR